MFGVLLSYYYHYHFDAFHRFAARWRCLLLFCGLGLLLPPFLFDLERSPLIYTVGFTGLYLGSGALLVVALSRPAPNNAIAAFLAFVGAHSYSIYLWHMPVKNWGGEMLLIVLGIHPLSVLGSACYVFLSIAVGILMAKFVEIPVLRLRDRWFPSRSGVGAHAEVAATTRARTLPSMEVQRFPEQG